MEEEKNINESSPLYTSEVYTKQKPQVKTTFILIFSCLVISLGSFQFGYNLGVINSPEAAIRGNYPNADCSKNSFFQECVKMDELQYSIFVSILVLGALGGGIISGPIADLIGRRTTLFLCNIFFIVGSSLLTIFSNFYVFVVARFITGLGVGFTSVIVPLYIAEISPDEYRGSLGTIHQFMIVGAILVTSILGIPLSNYPGWRILFSIPIAVSIVQMCLLPFCPMSPKWLINKGWLQSAEYSLKRLRGVDNVVGELDASKPSEDAQPKSGGIFKVFRRQLIKPILIGVLLHVTQQFSGINAVIFYSTNIFKDAGIKQSAIATVIVGVINILATALSIYLVERLGRKKLLLASEIISAISFCILATSYILKYYKIGQQFMSYISVISVLTYVAGFAIGLGPVPWVMLSELYPDDVRGICQGAITSVNWICTFIIAVSFPSLAKLLSQFTFLPFAIFLVVSIVLTYFFVPETKGKTMQELTGNL